jgi:error-prone DNA polymerase
VDGFPLVVLAANREGYANLCDLISQAHRNDDRNGTDRNVTDAGDEPHLTWLDLESKTEGLLCLTGGYEGRLHTLLRGKHYGQAQQWIESLQRLFPGRLFVQLIHHRRPNDRALIRALSELAKHNGLFTVAANSVRHVSFNDYALYDALTCARLGTTIWDPHPQRPVNDHAFLRTEEQMRKVGFTRTALANTHAVAALCEVELLADSVTPPHAVLPEGQSASAYLRELCIAAFRQKYPQRSGPSGLLESTRQAAELLKKELSVIAHLQLDEFFLVVREVIQFARSRGIRCSGRGSAANSLVAYLLGITGVDPIRHHLLFERFLHTGRKGMPDIDVDFETHRRHEVIAWMEERFGPAHTAMTANLVTFRLRLAVREMAKALGYPLVLIDRVTKLLPHASARRVRDHRRELAAILGDSLVLEVLLCLVERLAGCPRHLSLHSGGMILSRQPLRYLSPLQTSANGVRQIQFTKDDVEAAGQIKFDVLGLRMLSVVTEAVQLQQTIQLQQTVALPKEDTGSAFDNAFDSALDVDNLPPDDAATYELIRQGRTMSVFQIESPGQWNLLSRTQPQNFDDLVAQVALFRPGPLQGNMVHPYVLRRRGLQKVTYPHPCLEPVLRDTYGLILFQEQVLEVAHRFAGLSLEEADEFRRLMSKFRDAGEMEGMRRQFIEGAIHTHGVTGALANSIFDMVAKFVGYGFCRSHAAAFAQTVYQSAYLKAHHPAAFMAAVLEHKPGFYPLSSIIEEAKHCGVKILPIDIRTSDVKYRLERGYDNGAIRIPLTQIKGVSAEVAAPIVLERLERPFATLEDLYKRVRIDREQWDNMARSGALNVFGERRQVLWRLGELQRLLGPSGREQAALDALELPQDSLPHLRRLSTAEQITWDYQTQGITAGPHPVALHRPYLERLGATPIKELAQRKLGERVLVAGAVISRQKPPTARGMCFVILEDETGRLPTAITPPVYEKYHREVRSVSLIVEGKLEGSGPGQIGFYRSILIGRLWPLDRALGGYTLGGYSGHPGETPR